MDKEYVERDEFIKRLRGEYIAKYPLEFCLGLFAAANELEDAPAADVVEVVRCKDCEHADDGCAYGLVCANPCGMLGALVSEFDFCSGGKRKDEGK